MREEGADRFADAYEEHVWRVYGFFGYRVASREEAEDLTQQTFERALAAWDRFDDRRASVGTWLMAIAHNALIDHYRRGRARAEGWVSVRDSIEERVVDEPSLGLSPDLEAALLRLGQREREVIALRFGGDLTGAQIAELTGLTVANVQQILSRSLRRLREELDTASGARSPR